MTQYCNINYYFFHSHCPYMVSLFSCSKHRFLKSRSDDFRLACMKILNFFLESLSFSSLVAMFSHALLCVFGSSDDSLSIVICKFAERPSITQSSLFTPPLYGEKARVANSHLADPEQRRLPGFWRKAKRFCCCCKRM